MRLTYILDYIFSNMQNEIVEMQELKSLVDETLQEAQELIDMIDPTNRALINKVDKIISNLVLGIDMI
jgi:hypothetical protein